MSKQFKIWLIVLSCLLFLGIFYYSIARNWVRDLYQDKASPTLTSLAQWLYPRFFTEKHRFDLAFFLQKTDQMLGRFSVLVLGLAWLVQYRAGKQASSLSVPESIGKFVQTQTLCYYFTVLALFFTWDWYFELAKLEQARAFYAPVFVLRLFGLPFPVWQASLVLCLLLWVSAIGISVGKAFRAHFATLFFVLFVLLQGYQMSFYKIDHHFAMFTYWAFLMPCLLACEGAILQERIILPDGKIIENSRSGVKVRLLENQYFWVWLMQWAVAFPYTLAGLEKILIGGSAWFYAHTLQAYLHLHAQPWGLWLAQFDYLCWLLGVGMLFWETFFVLVLWFRWACWVFLPLGVLFHLGTFILFGAGALVHPWWLCYGIFVFPTKKEATRR